MDENFISELVAEGEKNYEIEVPLSMTMLNALNSLKGTVEEVIQASGGWKDEKGLKAVIAIEAEAWKSIFQQALQVAESDELSMVNTLAEGGNADKLLELAKSGNKVMKHFFITGQGGADVLKIFFVFRSGPGPQFQASIDFG